MNKRFSSFVAWKQLDRREDIKASEGGVFDANQSDSIKRKNAGGWLRCGLEVHWIHCRRAGYESNMNRAEP